MNTIIFGKKGKSKIPRDQLGVSILFIFVILLLIWDIIISWQSWISRSIPYYKFLIGTVFLLLGMILLLAIVIIFYLQWTQLHEKVILTTEKLILPRPYIGDLFREKTIPYSRIEEIYTNPLSTGMTIIYRTGKGERKIERLWKQRISDKPEGINYFLDILRSKGVRTIEKDYKR